MKKMLFCWKCHKSTPHVYVGKESMAKDCGIARIIMAAVTFGATETVFADRYWQCEHCGNIEKQS